MIFARPKSKIDNLRQNSGQETVYVGVSGGVDSSVAAKRLIRAGYKVVGAFMKTWYPDWLPCDWKSERRDAMRVCARLQIPFVEYDLGDEYFNQVGMYLVNEYKSGRTPNPDVMCNRYVKFDAFWQAAQKDGADLIATGHYAQRHTTYDTGYTTGSKNLDDNNNLHLIAKAVDEDKDQTYFLWGIDPQVVPHILFPIGDTIKDQIRKEALVANLITATKPDSQGICFLGHVDIKDFLGHYLDLEPGPVVDTAGKIVGEHDSAYIYTIGQRHGFRLFNQTTDSESHYVIKKDITTNTLVIGNADELASQTTTKTVDLIQINQFCEIKEGQSYQVRFRYRQSLINAQVAWNNGGLRVIFEEDQFGIAPGQSLVIYDGDQMIGGGIIS